MAYEPQFTITPRLLTLAEEITDLRERNCQINLGRLQGAGQRSKPEIADEMES